MAVVVAVVLLAGLTVLVVGPDGLGRGTDVPASPLADDLDPSPDGDAPGQDGAGAAATPAPGSADEPVDLPADELAADLAQAELVGRYESVEVVDGDTVVARGLSGRDQGRELRIRFAIVDTPEVGECGFDEATSFVEGWLADRGGRFDLRRPVDAPQIDPFDRILGELLEASEGPLRASLNVALVTQGLARIDGRFGAEDPDLLRRLRAARDVAPLPACPDLAPPPAAAATRGGRDPVYANCDEARAAGVAPILQDEPGYAPHLDRSGDGIACR
jgi:endonuclease YncB( thermonuclease family)